jgi:UTP--glucose-1-phosphate uridylyltransferase
MKAIRKAVIPVAGLGTRFLPATKAIPKEMLTIVDRPTIQYIVEEAVASGIEEIILITSAGKSAIENHFDYDFQLDTVLRDRNKVQMREELNNISNLIDIISVRQKEPLGLGHAIWMARNVVGDEPFMVLLGDDLVMSKVPCCKQMIELYEQVGESIVAIQHVPMDQTHQYGIVEGMPTDHERTYKVDRMVEKPAPGTCNSDMAIIGRYLLMPEIFEYLEKTTPGHGGEIQLTDALLALSNNRGMYAYEFNGKRYDAGDKLGYLKAIVDFAEDVSAAGHEIKPIAELLDPAPLFPQGLIPFFRWVANYYHHPLGEVIRTALPGGLTAGSGRKIILTEAGREAIGSLDLLPGGGDAGWMERLLAGGELSPGTVARLWREPALRRTFLHWREQGWIRIEAEVIHKRFKEKRQTRVKMDSARYAELQKAAGSGGQDLSASIDVLLPGLKKSEHKTLALLFALSRDAGGGPVARSEITRRYPGAGKALGELGRKNIVSLEDCRVYRDPFGRQSLFFPQPENLSEEQETVLGELFQAMGQGIFQPFLLHGITGCGKTEVYLRGAEKALADGKSVLVLAPEIALASQLEGHFYCRFGENLALLHSSLSAGEHHDQWQRIASGQAKVVIGARSAVFAPLDNLGLVIVDEEHEPAYKQEDGLRYNGQGPGRAAGPLCRLPGHPRLGNPVGVSYHATPCPASTGCC